MKSRSSNRKVHRVRRVNKKRRKAVAKRSIFQRRRRKTRSHRPPRKIKPIQKVRISESHSVLYVNVQDRRGRELLYWKGVNQPKLTRFWRKAVDFLRPTIVIEAGINYGEILFSKVYDGQTTIIGIEANPLLHPCISKSLEAHPNRSQINVINAIVSDKDGEEKTFFVNKRNSNTSTAVAVNKHPFIQPLQVTTLKIESLFTDRTLSHDRLLFKIDVEGYEELALKGLDRLTRECDSFIGHIEFNHKYLQKAGTKIVEYLAYLDQNFQVYLHRKNNEVLKYNNLQLKNMTACYNRFGHIDLLLLPKNQRIAVEQLGFNVRTVS